MGNCCAVPESRTDSSSDKKTRRKQDKHQNLFFDDQFSATNHRCIGKLHVLKEPNGKSISSHYNLGRELGRGEFGITYLCTDINTGEKFACKSISKKKLRTAVDIEDVRREVEIMKHLPNHPNIVSLKSTYEDDTAVHIVMELCEGGELFDRIVACGHYTELEAAKITRTIVEVVQMCHKHGVMHRDLKPENFLFGSNAEEAPLKAIDFGLSVFFKPGESFNEIVGSPYYMAPEVLKRNYGPLVDVWSAGVILYILLCGVPPFWAETEQRVAQEILRSVISFQKDPWPSVSDEAKDLVKMMLNPDPTKRITAEQVLDHPWLRKGGRVPKNQFGETVKAKLKKFSVINKLKKLALRVVAEHLSVEEVAGIKDVFAILDEERMGKITIEQLKAGLPKIGYEISCKELEILMKYADVDGDGRLSLEEFIAVYVRVKKMTNDEHLHKAFIFFDVNKTGFIEIDELSQVLNKEGDVCPMEVIQAVMQEIDLNKDGRVSYEEFEALMKAGTDWRKASRQYSRERFSSLSLELMKDGSLQVPFPHEKILPSSVSFVQKY